MSKEISKDFIEYQLEEQHKQQVKLANQVLQGSKDASIELLFVQSEIKRYERMLVVAK